MKRTVCIILAVFMLLSFSSCKDNNSEQDTGSSAESAAAEKIDVDLTKLSSTMIYSEVYAMMSTPEKYVGKTVKIKGKFTLYTNDDKTKNYYACVVADATACCSQGLEFRLKDQSLKYPNDYPALDKEITVIGNFSTYMEGNDQYCELINAELFY